MNTITQINNVLSILNCRNYAKCETLEESLSRVESYLLLSVATSQYNAITSALSTIKQVEKNCISNRIDCDTTIHPNIFVNTQVLESKLVDITNILTSPTNNQNAVNLNTLIEKQQKINQLTQKLTLLQNSAIALASELCKWLAKDNNSITLSPDKESNGVTLYSYRVANNVLDDEVAQRGKPSVSILSKIDMHQKTPYKMLFVFRGVLRFQEDGEYKLFFSTNNPFKLWINTELLIDGSDIQSIKTKQATFAANKHDDYEYVIECKANTDDFTASLAWQHENQSDRVVIPSECFFINKKKIAENGVMQSAKKAVKAPQQSYGVYRYFSEDNKTYYRSLEADINVVFAPREKPYTVIWTGRTNAYISSPISMTTLIEDFFLFANCDAILEIYMGQESWWGGSNFSDLQETLKIQIDPNDDAQFIQYAKTKGIKIVWKCSEYGRFENGGCVANNSIPFRLTAKVRSNQIAYISIGDGRKMAETFVPIEDPNIKNAVLA